MRHLLSFTLSFAVGLVSFEWKAWADPPGFIRVANSAADFSDVQGSGGWWYSFDRGPGTSVQPMPYFMFSWEHERWCATPVYGGGSAAPSSSHCTLMQRGCHTNFGVGCATPAQGTLRPIRTWMTSRSQRLWVNVKVVVNVSDMQQFDLLADGNVVWSVVYPQEQVPPEGAWIEVPSSQSISLRVTPLGACSGSEHELSIHARDCNGDGAADVSQIQNGTLPDINGNWIPDVCEVPTCADADFFRDFNVNGADLGILLSQWGPSNALTVSDLNLDGTVDGLDLGIFLAFWGPCP
jgi:hypothetical protein